MARRVLMVDDSKTTRDMVVFTLRRAGYEVIEADDGRKALERLGNDVVDCVITDLNMPGMDGLELIRALRASTAHRETPILMLTTEDDAARQQAGQQAGANKWLGKPFHPKTLVETVAQMIV
jgi:two-component system chemotaxis response regulator CheY